MGYDLSQSLHTGILALLLPDSFILYKKGLCKQPFQLPPDWQLMLKWSSMITPKSVSEFCLPRQSACLSLVLCKLVFSYLPMSVMGPWPGKSGLRNSNLPLSLFICLPQASAAEVLCHCVHQWTHWIMAKGPQPFGFAAKRGCVYWWLPMIHILRLMEESVFNPDSY